MTKVGEHITLDIIGTTKEYDPSIFEKVIYDIAKAAKVTILNISKYKFEPQGFTILALLAESHISFHTFPERGIISFDFFTMIFTIWSICYIHNCIRMGVINKFER